MTTSPVKLTVTVLIAAIVSAMCAADSKAGNEGDVCRVEGAPSRLVGLPEASGLALSRNAPGSLWSLNDSGKPLLLSVDTSGHVQRSVDVTGAQVDDWEDVSVGSCANGSCLFIGDIGDNNGSRTAIVVYRVSEPRAENAAAVQAEPLMASYPDGPHDAEALFVTSTGELFVITKERPSVLYKFPGSDEGRSARLERVVALPLDRVTDAETSPDGTWVAVRTNNDLAIFRTADLVSGNTGGAVKVDLRGLKEPQGEGVALDSNGTVYLAGEGGARDGTFATLRCALPR